MTICWTTIITFRANRVQQFRFRGNGNTITEIFCPNRFLPIKKNLQSRALLTCQRKSLGIC